MPNSAAVALHAAFWACFRYLGGGLISGHEILAQSDVLLSTREPHAGAWRAPPGRSRVSSLPRCTPALHRPRPLYSAAPAPDSPIALDVLKEQGPALVLDDATRDLGQLPAPVPTAPTLFSWPFDSSVCIHVLRSLDISPSWLLVSRLCTRLLGNKAHVRRTSPACGGPYGTGPHLQS